MLVLNSTLRFGFIFLWVAKGPSLHSTSGKVVVDAWRNRCLGVQPLMIPASGTHAKRKQALD